MKSIVGCILLVGAAVVGWLGYGEYQHRGSLAEINRALAVPDASVRSTLALDFAEASLKDVQSPNLYALIKTEAIAAIAKQQGLFADALPALPGMKSLKWSLESIGTSHNALSLSVRYEGELDKLPLGMNGVVTVTAVPNVVGADIELYPVDASITVESVAIHNSTDRDLLPKILSSAAKPIVNYAISRIGALTIPLQLGVSHELNLEKTLSAIPGVHDVKNSSSQVHLLVDKPAIFATDDGLHLVGSGSVTSQQEINAAVTELKALARQAKVPVPPAECVVCAFSYSNSAGYISCLRRYLDCNADRALKVRGPKSQLKPIQSLAIRRLAAMPDEESQNLYRTLQPLLLPSLVQVQRSTNASTDSARAVQIVSSIAKLQKQVAPNYIFGSDAAALAIRRDALAASLNSVAAGMLPTASISIAPVVQAFNQTIKSPPASDLKCDESNPCKSDFDTDYNREHQYKVEGCNSNCPPRHVCDSGDISKFLNHGQEICTDVPDVNCAVEKGKCELRKEAARLDREAQKATAKVAWSVEKAACETKKTGCKIDQERLRAFGDKDLGNVTGNASISPRDVTVHLSRFAVSNNLDQVALDLSVGGTADIDASFIYTPLNGGHILCVAQWGGNVRASASLSSNSFSLGANLDQTQLSKGIVYKLNQTNVGVKIQPAPGAALLSQNPHLALACPLVGAALNPTVMIGLSLLDTINVPLPTPEIPVPLLGDSIDALPGWATKVRMLSQEVVVTLNQKTQ
jgi:hypothetical protein